ncbi:MAG: peptidase M48 [Proteobacteria bacterium]|nr:MAG: peptidase M48 [Pseudomonadota bacterium]
MKNLIMKNLAMKNGPKFWILIAALILVAGCASVAKIATETAMTSGAISEEQADSLHRTIDAVDATFRDITPEQEYYLGRAVAARILVDYQALDDAAVNAYLNRIGQTLAMASDRPETFGGYHFLLLDSSEVNAFAAPGGLVLVSRGMVDLCHTEDELAAVLAHEIGHVVAKHGLRAIKKSRLTSAFTILATESARNFGGEDLQNLVNDYDGSINDITSALVVNGYSRGLEQEADAIALELLQRVGYNPWALKHVLEEMDRQWDPRGPGFARTHPSPQDRIGSIQPLLAGRPEVKVTAARADRFARAVGD